MTANPVTKNRMKRAAALVGAKLSVDLFTLAGLGRGPGSP